MQYLVVEEGLDICREDYLMFASVKSAKQSVQYHRFSVESQSLALCL